MQKAVAGEARTERVKKIKTCLAEADSNYESMWNSACKAEKKEAACSLPSDRAQVIEHYKIDEKDLCFKLYDYIDKEMVEFSSKTT